MSLKAGRVGVAPDQVDLFGNIIGGGSGGDAYTKAESDAKFETITNAASTYETKSHAASTYVTEAAVSGLQPQTLAVPISMLTGSKLTVENALNGLNDLASNILTVTTGDAEKIELTNVRAVVQGRVCCVQAQIHILSGYSQASAAKSVLTISGVPHNGKYGCTNMIETNTGKVIPLYVAPEVGNPNLHNVLFTSIAVAAGYYSFTYTWIC